MVTFNIPSEIHFNTATAANYCSSLWRSCVMQPTWSTSKVAWVCAWLKFFVSLHWVIDLPMVSLYTVKLHPMISILFPPIATETLNCFMYCHRRLQWPAPYADPLPWPWARPTVALQCSTLQDTSQGGDDGDGDAWFLWHHSVCIGEQCPTLSHDDPDNNPNPPADARDERAVWDMLQSLP